MVGKNPHRPEGKASTDNEHMQAAWMSAGPPHDASANDKARAELDLAAKERRGGEPDTLAAEESIGGSRPGVPSRVKEAIASREEEE